MRTVKIIKTLLIVAALPMLAGAATRRYIVELSTEPAARFASRSFGAHKEALTRPEVQTHRSNIRAEQDKLIAQIQQLGGRILSRTDTASNTLTVELPEENASKLATLSGVKNSHKERHFKAQLDQAGIVHHLPETYALIGGFNVAGLGMKIGMIDSGIDVTQPAFSGTGFTPPAGFPKVNAVSDTMYTNGKVIVARSYVSLLDNQDIDYSAADEDGHGTSTADCAAGMVTAFTGSPSFTGIAPGAYLGSYKVFGTPGYNDSPNDTALLAAIEDAVKDGMDVINYSIGSIFPIPLIEDQEATALSNAYSMGILVTVSSGDEGNGWFPFTGNDQNLWPVSFISADGNAVTIPTFANTEGSGNVITVGGSSNQRAFGMTLTIGSSSFLVDSEDAVTTDNNGNALVFNSAPIVDVTSIDGTGQACNALPANSLNGAIAFISINGWDPSTDNCNPATKLTNVGNAGAVAGIIYDNLEEDWRNFFDFSYIYGYSYFSGQDGVTNSTNVPGGFITMDDGTTIHGLLASQANSTATIDFNYTYGNVVPLSPDRMSFGSTRGPNVSYEIKPEVVAVGEFLLTASQTLDPNGNLYDASGLLFPIDGTSASAPIVAGAGAILKAARPGLTTDQYRSLLVNNAVPIHSCTLPGQYPACPQARVMDAGAGLLNVLNSMNAEATVVPATLSFGVADGSATQNKTLTVTNAGSAGDTFNLSVVGRDPGFTPQVSPASLQLGPGQSATVQVTIPGGVLTAGEYEGDVHIQGANTAVDTHVPYWFGIPSSTPYVLVDLGSDIVDSRGQTATEAIVFRLTDASRIIMNNLNLSQVSITFKGVDTGSGVITSGSGKVNNVYYDNQYSPGTIGVDITLDTRRNVYNIYEVKVGPLVYDYYILGQ
jgi:minor extracellular serine protease Vpr